MIRKKLIAAGVKNLQVFGYPNCTKDNILTDMIYKTFFTRMLEENKGTSALIDTAISALLAELNPPTSAG